MSFPIPETGQQTEVVRLHPIVWNSAIALIRELQDSLVMRSLIINQTIRTQENQLVDALIEFVRVYALTIHFQHYVRLGVAMNGFTPSKGRAFYSESVPEIFILIARHLARPRLLIDGSVSLPIVTAPICDGVLYGGLPALNDADQGRNGIAIGPPDPTLAACNVFNSAIRWRPRLYLELKRTFTGLPYHSLSGPEGLVPARLCYFANHRNHFVHFLDLNDKFEKQIYDLDTLLNPLVFDIPNYVALGINPDVAAYQAHVASLSPPTIQWMAHDYVTGVAGRMDRSVFLEREASAFHASPTLTHTFVRNAWIATLSNDLEELNFPKPGTVDAKLVSTLRQLVNDMGDGRPPLTSSSTQRRDNRRRSNQASRQDSAARKNLSREVKLDIVCADENATAPEDAKEEDIDAIDPHLQVDKRKKKRDQRNAGRRNRSRKP